MTTQWSLIKTKIIKMKLGAIEKGYYGSLITEEIFIRNGFNVFKPSMENGKVDMIVEKNNIYLKLQIKTVQSNKEGKKFIPIRKVNHNGTGYKITLYTSDIIDYFIGIDIETKDIYIIPITFLSKYKNTISIKVIEQFKNNFSLMELYNGNIINGEDDIDELLTGNADDNIEGTE
jgi:hypothetical protein